MIDHATQQITIWLHSMNHVQEQFSQLLLNSTLVAQTITDPDLLGQFQSAFHNFIATGQVWALIIGLVVGYMLRGMTTYG